LHFDIRHRENNDKQTNKHLEKKKEEEEEDRSYEDLTSFRDLKSRFVLDTRWRHLKDERISILTTASFSYTFYRFFCARFIVMRKAGKHITTFAHGVEFRKISYS
jgi:hypothetical protein